MNSSPALDAPAGSELIQRAAISTSGLNQSALLERAFAFAFRGLVYPQIWEDPVADMAGLQIQPGENVVTIASGGCNAFSYLTADPGRVTAVDLNAAHVALNRLKHAAILHLPDYAQYRAFFADANRAENVDAYFSHIAPHLDATSRKYWESRDLMGRKRIGCFARGFYRYGLLGTFHRHRALDRSAPRHKSARRSDCPRDAAAARSLRSSTSCPFSKSRSSGG